MIAICSQYQGTHYYDACAKSLEAGTLQTGIRQKYDSAEGKANQFVTKTAEENLGKSTVTVIASGAYVYKVVNQKSLTFRLPTFGFANSLSNTVTPNSYTLNIGWNW